MKTATCIGFLLLVTPFAFAQPSLDLRAQPTINGLFPVSGTNMDRVFALPDAGLSFYQSLYVAPVDISYRRPRGVDGQRAPHAVDREMLVEMSEYFREAVRSAASRTDYRTVDQPELGTLTVRAAIQGLTPGSGARAATPESPAYFASIAEMTLVLELSDATTGELLVQVADAGVAARKPGVEAVTNREAVKKLLDDWAELLATRLQEIKEMGEVLAER